MARAQSPADFSEADFFDDLPVVLSASRLLQPLNEAPVAVTVIDREMIRASGFRDIPDLLRLVPGFSVAYTQFNTWTGAYHGLGDGYFRRFQVRVDGRSIYSPHNGAVLWSDLPLAIDDIERIEVVRGPDAAVYGANAFAGVVNIITKTAAQVPGTFVSMQAGNKDMRGLTARHGGGDETVRYRLTASAQQRDRFERDTDEGQFFEASQTYLVNGRVDWQLAPDADVMAQFGLSQGNWNSGQESADVVDSRLEPREQDSRAQYLQFAYHKVVSERREWRAQFYHSQNRFDANQLADFSDFGLGMIEVDQYVQQRRTSLDLVVNEQWAPSLRGVWGGEVWYESVKSPLNYDSDLTQSGTVWRIHGNLEWRAHERVLLHGGVLLEDHYITGTDISPRLAANFTLTPGHVVRMGISRAYRSPTFFEEDGSRVIVNQSGTTVDYERLASDGLDPERILSREIGYVGQWPKARLEMDVRLFDDDIEDFIGDSCDDVIPGDARAKECQYGNRGSVHSRGGEIQLRWRPLPVFDVSAHFAHVLLSNDFTEFNVGKDIPQSAPRNSWGLLARFLPGDGWETSLFVQQADDIKWLEDGDFTEGFTRVDVRVARRWKWQGNELEAALVGQNLGDDYSEFRESNIFSRRVYGSLSIAW
jgi:iron complex outermembrane receptor protein